MEANYLTRYQMKYTGLQEFLIILFSCKILENSLKLQQHLSCSVTGSLNAAKLLGRARLLLIQ